MLDAYMAVTNNPTYTRSHAVVYPSRYKLTVSSSINTWLSSLMRNIAQQLK